MQVREATPDDWPAMWWFMRRIVAAGETFSWDRNLPEEQAHERWCHEPPGRTFVAVDGTPRTLRMSDRGAGVTPAAGPNLFVAVDRRVAAGDGRSVDDRRRCLAVGEEAIEQIAELVDRAQVDLEVEAVLAGDAMGGVDGLAAAMLCAFVFVSPIGLSGAAHAFSDPIALVAGVGVGVSSSVVPYVFDQLAMACLPRATYALFVALLPATATVIGIIALRQLPSPVDLAGIALVMIGVALHRPDRRSAAQAASP